MTKSKRVAAVAVSVVLAGSLAVSITACGKKKSNNSYADGVVNMALADGAELDVAIGYSSSDTGLFYGATVGANDTKFVGGYTANFQDPKPATKGIMDATGIELVDAYEGKGTSENLTELVNANKWGSSVDMATSDLSVAASNSNLCLNLADYLQYMPNFRAFLEENPIVYLSVLGDGLEEDGSGETLYVAPYFDGMDDIEKGVLMRHDWVEAVLDYTSWTGTQTGTASTQDSNGKAADGTFWNSCYAVLTTDASNDNAPIETSATSTHATSYMGTTGSWSIVSTAEPMDNGESDGSETVTITKDYEAALNALNGSDGEGGLLSAYQAIAGTGVTYSGESGNIVDIMNTALETGKETNSAAATGKNMAELYKAYVDVAYTYDDGTESSPSYGSDKLPYSKIFTGYSGCWDVDDLTVLLRIIKCSSGQVGLWYGQETVGIYPRTYDNGRTPDIVSLVGELYGARGATSRYEQTYIDSDGVLQDARNDEKFWDALVAFGGLAQEGLVDSGYTLNGTYNSNSETYTNDMHGTTSQLGVGFMQWDYSQTQTTHEFDIDDINYGWVNTPVSIWDDGTKASQEGFETDGYSYINANNGAGSTGKYMRFTDSWRSVKTSGLVVAKTVANDERKLAAALKFVDFLYSNDGQITTTYALQDTTNGGSTPDGTWYGTPVTGAEVNEKTCNEVYQYIIKDEYKDKYTVYNGMICDKNGKAATDDTGEDISSQLDIYASRISDWSVKEDQQGNYFAYGGSLYEGTLYKGKMTPTITEELYNHFICNTKNSEYSAEYDLYPSVRGSFTNFARYILGSTLPICVKDQSFENQMTATVAKDDATKVGVSIGNGTINHCKLTMTENPFYTCVPTGFPLSNLDQQNLDNASMNTLMYETGKAASGSGFYALYHHVIWYGWSGTYKQNTVTVDFTSISSSKDMVTKLNGDGLGTRLGYLRNGWEKAKTYWTYLSN